MTAYTEKLRDPRWQKMRLEIMQRDEFTCQVCSDKESTLNVHHRFYLRGHEPWDYPEWSLVTLCESCHTEETALLKKEPALLLDAMFRSGATSADFNCLAEALSFHFEYGTDERFWCALSWVIREKPQELIDAYFEALRVRFKDEKESMAGKDGQKPEASCTEP